MKYPRVVITVMLMALTASCFGAEYRLEIYSSSYDASTKKYTAALNDSFNTTTDVDSTNTHMVIPDQLFTLSAGAPLISLENTLMDFNLNGLYKLGNSVDSFKDNLSASVIGIPVIIRKSPTELYYIYYNSDTYYQYTYLAGSHNLNGEITKRYIGESIQEIIAKFSVIFVITGSYIYIQDIANPNTILNKIPTTGNDYNIARDDITGHIYLMPNGLSCRVADNCADADKVYIDLNCSTNGDCAKISDIDDISSSLGLVYEETNT
jgi:hypothetical protein